MTLQEQPCPYCEAGTLTKGKEDVFWYCNQCGPKPLHGWPPKDETDELDKSTLRKLAFWLIIFAISFGWFLLLGLKYYDYLPQWLTWWGLLSPLWCLLGVGLIMFIVGVEVFGEKRTYLQDLREIAAGFIAGFIILLMALLLVLLEVFRYYRKICKVIEITGIFDC